MTGDFELDGYSSYSAMTDFVNGIYKVTDGEMISDFTSFECVVSEELATLNELTVGSTITLKNPNTEKTYDFVIKGIYQDNSNQDDSNNMYPPSANKIITGTGVIENPIAEDSTLVTNITPSFVLQDKITKITLNYNLKEIEER